jgi:hypothetical protein
MLSFMLVLFLFISNCKGAEDDVVLVETEDKKPEVIYQVFFVNVDNLRVRQAPNLESTVLDKIREGTLVNSKNEYSDKKETITLRGKKMTAPYYFVTGDEFMEGWVYGGALVKIYQNTSPAPFTSRLQEVIASLKNLNYSEIDTGSKLFAKLREFKGNDPVWNDGLFVIGKYFFGQLPDFFLLEDEQPDLFSTEDYKSIFEGKYDMNSTMFTSRLEKNGYKLEASEGQINAVRNEAGFIKIMPGPHSVPMRAHFEIKEKYENSKISEDDGLVIDLKALIDLAISEELFLQTYPEFIYSNEHTETKETLQFILMNGLNNTPAIAYDTKEINPIFIEAWQYARNKYPDSDLVKELDKNKLSNKN